VRMISSSDDSSSSSAMESIAEAPLPLDFPFKGPL
jgi:hypothetical protein